MAVGWAGAGLKSHSWRGAQARAGLQRPRRGTDRAHTAGRGLGDGPMGMGVCVHGMGSVHVGSVHTGPVCVALQHVQGTLCTDGTRGLHGLWGAGAARVPTGLIPWPCYT